MNNIWDAILKKEKAEFDKLEKRVAEEEERIAENLGVKEDITADSYPEPVNKQNRYELTKDLPGWMLFQERYDEAKAKNPDLLLAVDTETSCLSPFDDTARPLGISLCFEKGYAVYVLWAAMENATNLYSSVKNLLENANIAGHNFKFDYQWLYTKMGIDARNIAFDTMLADYWLYNKQRKHDLDSMSERYLKEMAGYKGEVKEMLKENGDRMDLIPLEILLPYACGDADAALRLTEILKKEIIENFGTLDSYRKLCIEPTIPLARMEMNGVQVDTEVAEELEKEFQKRIREDEEKMDKYPFIKECIEAFACEELKKGVKKMKTSTNSKDDEEQKLHKIIADKTRDLTKLFNSRRFQQYLFYKKLNFPFDYEADNPRVFVGDMVEGETKETSCGRCYHCRQDRRANCRRKEVLGHDAWTKGKVRSETFFSHRQWALDRLSEAKKNGDAEGARKWKEVVEFCSILINYKADKKIFDTYVKKLPEWTKKDGRIHTSYLQHGTRTGRLSTDRPSIHNIPRKSAVRSMLISRWRNRGGVILKCDGKQMEIVVLTSLAPKGELARVLSAGKDLHANTAARTLKKKVEDVTPEERQSAKAAMFAPLYGGGAETLLSPARQFQGMGEELKENPFADISQFNIKYEDAESFINEIHSSYPEIHQYGDSNYKAALEKGYIETPFGRRRPLGEVRSWDNSEHARARRLAMNTPIQSAASDIMLLAICRTEPIINKNFKSALFGFVHDELTIDVAPGELPAILELIHEEVVEGTKTHHPWMLPLQVEFEFGLSWGDTFKIKGFDLISNSASPTLQFSVEFEDSRLEGFEQLMNSLKTAYNSDYKIVNHESGNCIYNISLEGKWKVKG